MKHIVRKAFINYEKEEKWLNHMNSKGLALVDYSWCRYVFEECEPSNYIYRLEMLNSNSRSQESQNYIKFLEETGIEHVASYMRWIYLRKKSELGPFDLFSDLESKLEHHKRIALFLFPVALLNLVIGAINMFNWVFLDLYNNGIISILNIILGGVISYHVARHFGKVMNLKQEKTIYES